MQSSSTPPVPLAAHALVLGATSLIGAFLLPRLVGAFASVRAVSRAGEPACLEPGCVGLASVTWTVADLTRPDLVGTLAPIETVFSLSPVWLLPPLISSLVDAGMRRLVAVSSTSRLSKAASPLAEERRVAAQLAWGEDETARLCDAHGVAWTLLRPTLIYAEGRDRNVSRLARLIDRFGVLPLSGAGGGLRQPVHADDLAWAAAAVRDAPATFGRTYDLAGGETLSYRRMVERIFIGLGRRPLILPVPPALWRAGLRLCAPLLPGATTAMGARMGDDLTFDDSDAKRDFGWTPRAFHPRFTAAKSDELFSLRS